jgi:hypothetical protein
VEIEVRTGGRAKVKTVMGFFVLETTNMLWFCFFFFFAITKLFEKSLLNFRNFVDEI